MKAYRIAIFCLLIVVVTMSAALAQIPNISAALGNTCTGMSGSIVQNDGTFTYGLTVNSGATFNGFTVLAVRDFIVYPNGGLPATAPTNITSLLANWSVIDYNVPNAGFGYGVDNQPLVNGVLPGQTKTIGSATFSAEPPNQVFVVHAIYDAGQGQTGSGFCIIPSGVTPPPVVPEPGTMALFGMGLAPLAGMIRRKRS